MGSKKGKEAGINLQKKNKIFLGGRSRAEAVVQSRAHPFVLNAENSRLFFGQVSRFPILLGCPVLYC